MLGSISIWETSGTMVAGSALPCSSQTTGGEQSKLHTGRGTQKWNCLQKRMNVLLKNSKSNHKNGFSKVFSVQPWPRPHLGFSAPFPPGLELLSCLYHSSWYREQGSCSLLTHLPDIAHRPVHWRIPSQRGAGWLSEGRIWCPPGNVSMSFKSHILL